VGTSNTVLSVSYSGVLRVTRESMLKDAGYEVISAANISEALEVLSGVQPACVILGHTVPLEDQVILALAAEKLTPRPRLVEIYTYRPNPEISPDARVQRHAEPEALIRIIRGLLSSSAAAGSE
jgi:DNA-binding NtrC family response regulator